MPFPPSPFSDLLQRPFAHRALWSWSLLLLVAVVMVRLTWISDDAAITFRSVLNLTHGYGPNFNLDERVQSYTHPLWFLLLTLGQLLLKNIFYSAILLSWVGSLAALWLLLRLRPEFTLWSLAAVLGLLFSQAFMDYTTSGLEGPLAFLLLALFVHCYLRPGRYREILLVLLASLCYLTRPDLILLVAPAVAVALYQQRRRPAAVVAALLLGGLPLLLWTLFSLIYYGLPLPNTAYAKLNNGVPQGELLLQGVRYLLDSLQRDPLTLTLLLFGCGYALRQRDGLNRLLALGVALYLFYIVQIGGDFMSGRFFAVPLFVVALLLARQPAATGLRAVPLLLLVVVVGLAAERTPLTASFATEVAAVDWQDGILDERVFYFADHGLVSQGRWQFSEPLPWVRRGESSGQLAEIEGICGGLGYRGLRQGPLVHIIDICALSDPLLARIPPNYHPNWRIGHFHRPVPVGYAETLLTGQNQIQPPEMAAAYAQVRLLTRGPLFTAERWRAIVQINLFGLDLPAPSPPSPVRELQQAAVSSPLPEGSARDAAGSYPFQSGEVLHIDLGGRQHAPRLELGLSGNHRYILEFYHQGRYSGQMILEPLSGQSTLSNRSLTVPLGVMLRGYDKVRLQGKGGDGYYSLGHLRLLP